MFKDIPIWHKYSLSIEESAPYFRIGENKLRQIAADNPDAPYILWNGNRAQFKRVLFSQFLDQQNAI